jgi:hypothetical protein
VTAAGAKFTFGGMAVDVKRERIEGLIYFQPAGRQLVDPVAKIEDVTGSVWNAKTVALTGDKVQLTTTVNVKAELPLDKVAGFDFSSGKVLSLVQLKPDTQTFTPFITDGTPDSTNLLFHLPRKGRGFYGQPLKLRTQEKVEGQEYSDGLAIWSRTELVYRLPAAYRRFTALAGIDAPLVGGNVRLEISSEGKTLYEGTFASGQTSVPLDIDLAGARRLKVVVDYGDNQDTNDQLNLVNPRIWK